MKTPKTFTYNTPTSCSHRFSAGSKYLFYGDLDNEKENHFVTGLCTRTQSFEENLTDLDFLNALESPTPKYWIWGTFSRGQMGSAIAGVKAEVSDGGRILTGVSDKNGDLKFVVSKEGRYTVRVYPPKGAELGTSQWEEQLSLFNGGGKSKKGDYVQYEVDVINNRCGWFDTVLYGLKK